MSFNTFGKIFRFTTWGESHGPAIGCVVDGCPPNIKINEKDIQSELDKKVKSLDVGIIIVDYLNQVRRHNVPSRSGQYDWTEQIEVSKKLKVFAQDYETMVFSPYQVDASGEARFAKGILDAADAAYSLETWEQEDACMTFNCVKTVSYTHLTLPTTPYV